MRAVSTFILATAAASVFAGTAEADFFKHVKQSVRNIPAKAVAEAGMASHANPNVAVPIQSEDVPPEQIESGRLYTVALGPDLETAATRAIENKIQDLTQAPTAITTLPDVLRLRDADGQVMDLKAYVLVGRPLTYVQSKSTYTASLKVGVSPISDSWQSRKLSTPVTFEVLDSGIASEFVTRVDATSPPYAEINLEFQAEPNPREVRIATPAHPAGIAVKLIAQPSLYLVVERPAIEGYGLETSKIQVFVTGLDQREGRRIAFSSSPASGFFELDSPLTDANGHLTATFRSEGTGQTQVTASLPGIATASATVNFTLPTRTLGVSVLGGVVGGLIRLLSVRKVRGWQFIKGLLVAILTGALVFALYAVGVNTLPILPTVKVGSIVVFVISAVGAYIGNIKFTSHSSPA